MTPGIVIAGAGLAGLRAAQTLRRRGYEGSITLVGDEPHRPYNRPPLSKEVLLGKAEAEASVFPSDTLEVDWLLGRSATGLDPVRKVVELDGGDKLDYDKLVIATGSRARPWFEPVELEGVRLLRTLGDAASLREAALAAERVAIVGAGFLGCEVAAALRAQDVAVSIVDVAPYPMPVLGPEVGERAAQIHAVHGVDLHLGVGVEGFAGSDRFEGVMLGDGRRIDADLLLIAVGALPNTEWLAGSGLELRSGGVLCDEHCFAVGVTDVVAAGDVATWPHPAAAEPIRVEHWTNAAEMAIAAASNLLLDAAERTPHVPVLSFWSDQYDVKLRAAGMVGAATARSVVVDDPDEGRFVVEGRRDGVLVGAVTFNTLPDHMRYQRELAAPAAG